MWNIHGDTYDLTDFIEKHPGGRDILLRTKGLDDISALYETYHAFSNKDAIDKQLETYKVKEKAYDTLYDFTSYRKFINYIKEKTPYTTRSKIKWNGLFILKSLILFSSVCSTFYVTYISNLSFILKLVSAFSCGLFSTALGLNILHDGSHYGISTKPKINIWLGKIALNIVLWNETVWFYHHVWGHHSFTGNEKLDPDMKHFRPLIIKFLEDKSANPLLVKYQDKTVTFFSTIFPGAWFGQSMVYMMASFKRKIFGVKIPNIQVYDLFDKVMICTQLYFMLHEPRLMLVHFLAINIFYHINTILDHDMYDNALTHHISAGADRDWLKMQIQNSGDFITKNRLWTEMFGGINNQIEHHVLPNMCNVHYPIIKPYMKEYCKENNIPFVEKETLYDAYSSFLKFMKYIADNK
jgi:fatty acid desaturase